MLRVDVGFYTCRSRDFWLLVAQDSVLPFEISVRLSLRFDSIGTGVWGGKMEEGLRCRLEDVWTYLESQAVQNGGLLIIHFK